MRKIFAEALCIIRKNKILLLSLFLIPSFLLLYLAKHSEQFAEFYALHIYKYIALAVNNITGILPFSLAELIIILLPVIFFMYFVYWIIKIFKSKGCRLISVIKMIFSPICVACFLLFIYVIGCGINYYRVPFAKSAELEVGNSSVNELYSLCKTLAENTNKLSMQLQNEEMHSEMTIREISKEAASSYDLLAEEYSFISGGFSAPKAVFMSRQLSYTNINGIYFPFTFEANINTDVPSFIIPFTACHELAHLQGFMREDEANFMAFLACIGSNNLFFRYSGNIQALMYSLNKLSAEDHVLYYEVVESLDERIRNDFNQNYEYREQFSGKSAKAAAAINNAYLKANNLSEGLKSYGRMVDLLLAYHKSK